MKVSIVIPAYNAGEYIKRAIDSVKAQTYTDWECIVVDDCSTDNTALVVVGEMDDKHEFSYVHHKYRCGVAVARNTGISEAKGDAIFFLDADDWMEPGCLAYLCFLASQMPPEVGRIVSQPIVRLEGGSYRYWRMRPVGKHGPLSQSLFDGASCDVGHVTGCLYILDRIPPGVMRFPDVPIYEDLIFNMGLIAAGVSLFIAIKPVYNYFRHSGSITFGDFSIEDAEKVMDAYNGIILKYVPESDVIGRFDAFLENLFIARLGDKYKELCKTHS